MYLKRLNIFADVLPHKFRNLIISSFSNSQGRTDAVTVETKRHGGRVVSIDKTSIRNLIEINHKNVSFQHRSIRLNNEDRNK